MFGANFQALSPEEKQARFIAFREKVLSGEATVDTIYAKLQAMRVAAGKEQVMPEEQAKAGLAQFLEAVKTNTVDMERLKATMAKLAGQ
ncbi:hypothetical protein KIPB_007833 [Kipferlia bialata]|uniref:Uncharacterized protein n=1 Tax=Kipferlia bialata TaxID=797122 RepID=A0A9K3CZK9_9EUKA|nr:hypothetical protein KIPB_007833 [Kipferlia bialata]|eukprot:g7833.t1